MRNIFRLSCAAVTISLLIVWPASSYADWHGHDGGGHSHGGGFRHDRSFVGVNFSVWPQDYYYDAPYYPVYDDVLVSPPVTVLEPPVTVIEPSASPVIENPSSDTPDSITINIPNDKGGYTAITLKKSGNGYTGPQGEFYPEFPSVAKLKVIYGK